MEEKLQEYLNYLAQEEKSEATKKQYQRDISCFLNYAKERELSKELIIEYKEKLQGVYQPASVNAKLAALNGYFTFLGQSELRVRQLKIQRRAFCAKEKELTKQEYLRLVQAANRRKDERLSLLLQTICGTGIRVSEVQAITAEAVRGGEALIHNKGKIRVVLLPGKLCKILKRYMSAHKIITGPIFITRQGNPLDRSNIWKMMKGICQEAGVASGKVFPHNLRHLFARCFYAVDKDLAKLADILGHSNINTTRIYILSTGQEHRQHMETLGLVI